MLKTNARLIPCSVATVLIAATPAMGQGLVSFEASASLLNPQWETGFDSGQPLSDTTQEMNTSAAASFIIVGDMNGDGSLTNADISAFTLALTNRTRYIQDHADLNADYIGDFNGDHQLTNDDIAGFVQSLTTGETIQRISESEQSGDGSVAPTPSALGAGIASLLVLAARRRRRSA